MVARWFEKSGQFHRPRSQSLVRVASSLAAFSLCLLLLAGPATFSGCKKRPGDKPATGAKTATGDNVFAGPTPVPPAEIWKEFSGTNAFEHVRRLVELGPRPSGSDAIEQARSYISEALAGFGWKVERQEFSENTPRGTIRFVNLIARFRQLQPAETQKVIVASHFDTKRYDTIRFVGANDAGSSTGALIELARVLALDHGLARQIELVFFDGEEALTQFTETDGLYGSRFYARVLRESGRNRQFRFGILWDMIGDANLTITLSPDSPAELARGILEAASTLAMREHFTYHNRVIVDDHVPLNQSKIPTINLIDFDYLPWHTADDTLDKVAPESMAKIGAVTLFYLRQTIGKL